MKQAIQVMTREILQILDGQEPSLYLFGSVTMDDFHLGWSDIDFLCLTKRPISPAQRLLRKQNERVNEATLSL